MLRNNKFSFTGEGAQYFGLLIANFFLMLITVLIYTPWAIVKERKFFLENTRFSGKPFSYTGSGGDMLKGFLIALGVYIVVILLMYVHVALYVVGIIALMLIGVPYLIHELLDYDAKHTHWNEKTFEYTGEVVEFVKLAATNIGITMVTIGIYGAWARVSILKYIMQHLKLGKLTFDFEGEGSELFIIMLKGFFLSMITFGIYGFWFIKELNVYMTNKLVVYQDGRKCNFNSELKVGDVFNMIFVGMLLTMFTCGIGFAWAQVRSIKIMLGAIDISDELDPENL